MLIWGSGCHHRVVLAGSGEKVNLKPANLRDATSKFGEAWRVSAVADMAARVAAVAGGGPGSPTDGKARLVKPEHLLPVSVDEGGGGEADEDELEMDLEMDLVHDRTQHCNGPL